MIQYIDNIEVVNGIGNIVPVPNALVTVYYTGTMNLVPLYQDSGGSVSLPNPVITDSMGRLSFYSQGGIYDLYITADGVEPYWKKAVMVGLVVYDSVINAYYILGAKNAQPILIPVST